MSLIIWRIFFKMNIHSVFRDYSLTIEPDYCFLDELLTRQNAYFVIDSRVYELYKKEFQTIPENRLFVMIANEDNKVIETALAICSSMTNISAKRNAWLVSVGGGITQDVTGFVASTLYRGIHWAFVPTTLLAACDSCIGGKTSINYKGFKNLLGTFYPPEEIHICTGFFKTLSEEDYLSGLGEVFKFNFLCGEEGVESIEANIRALLVRDETVVSRFTKKSLEYKKKYIEQDEFDRGVRVYLNFAHTFAHAFESLSEYEIRHGTAVAIGTIVANRISCGRGMLPLSQVERMEALLKQIIPAPVFIKWSQDEIVRVVRKDKKQIDSALTAVLIDKDATPHIVHDLTAHEMMAAIDCASQVINAEQGRS